MKIQYENLTFRAATLAVIAQANEIIAGYAAQGFNLTLRQLYYQFVARDLLKNHDKEYKRLGETISKARRAGLIDWDAIVDRTRFLRQIGTWDNPAQLVRSCASQFRVDPWDDQPNYVEVWFEKDALLGVFERVCNTLRLPHFSCRGYTSDSEIWAAAQRLSYRTKPVTILHFGDHDPSGLDMTRDIESRVNLFGGGAHVEVRRLALNMNQIEQYSPPPNPAKEADSRFQSYLAEYGDESWELDALEPTVLAALVTDEVAELVDQDLWDQSMEAEREGRKELTLISDNYRQVVRNLEV